MVDRTRLGGIGTREVLEVKAFLLQLLTTRKAFAAGIQLLKDIPVARSDAVDLPDHVDLFVGLLVVIAVAARVAAELLVDTPDDRFTAIEAFSFLFFHLFNYLIFIYLVKTKRKMFAPIFRAFSRVSCES